MQAVLDVQTMRESDAAAIAAGTAGVTLMMRAAEGVVQSYPFCGKTAIVCGSGNNAGDGYAIALLLQKKSIDCTVFMLTERASSDGAYYLALCRQRKIDIRSFLPDTDFSEYREIVDCILGTGFGGAVEGLTETAIRAINQSGKQVISVDINSGLDGNSGMARLCVRSDLTVSVGSLKSGLLLGDAKDHIGRLVNVDIGIAPLKKNRFLCEMGDFGELLQKRRQNSHKGNYGYVSVMGGCISYTGAVKLANLSCAALRSGCGVAQLILPQSLAPAVAPYLLESTLCLLPDRDGFAVFDADALNRALTKQSALAVGMGWGTSPENARMLSHILQKFDIPVVIDADGLNTLATMELSVLKQTRCRVILTPHQKEMERLCGASIAEIAADPVGVAERFAREYGVTVLLKGACTVVSDGETTYFVNRGCAGMATAGSGDVLSGILAGLLGFCSPTAKTVACGAFIAGLAGELAERDSNPISMLASDTVAHIAEAVGMLLQASCEKKV